MESDSQYLKIKDLAEQDRPREKLISQGASVLTDSELLGIIIGSGVENLSAVDVAKSILKKYDDNLRTLGGVSFAELCKFKGIGPAKAVNILAVLELGRRREGTCMTERPTVLNSTDAFRLLHPRLADLNHEELLVVYLNRRNVVLGIETLSKGGMSGTVFDVRLAMKKGIELSASAMIMAHNHPSGTLRPSTDDDRITKKMVEAGNVMDIPLRDHIIIVPCSVTEKSYYSYCDEGKI